MLQRLILKNIQAHKATQLVLSKGVNAIVPGDLENPNNIGKTSIVRALLMLFSNRPIGAKYFHDKSDPGSMSVSAEFDDIGEVKLIRKVKRSRKGELKIKGSRYEIKGHTYKGFGAGIPEPVKKALNVEPEINIQREDDSPYLISGSSTDITRAISRAIGLDKANIVLKIANRKVDSARRDVRDTKAEIHENRRQLKRLSGIEKIGDLFSKNDRLKAEIEKAESEVELIEKFMSMKKGLRSADPTPVIKLFEALAIAGGRLGRLTDKTRELARFIEQSRQLGSLRRQARHSKERFETKLAKLGRCPLCGSKVGEKKGEK